MKKISSIYESNYENKVKFENSDAASSAVSVSSKAMEKQGKDLKVMQNSLEKIQHMVYSAIKRITAVEKTLNDFEQYVRSNCSIIHGYENDLTKKKKTGKNLETDKYMCNILNISLQLESALQIEDFDVAHPQPSKKGTPLLLNLSGNSTK